MNWDFTCSLILKNMSGFGGKCNGVCFFLHRFLMLRKLWGILIIGQLIVQFLFVLPESIEN